MRDIKALNLPLVVYVEALFSGSLLDLDHGSCYDRELGGAGWETADDWAALFGCVIIAFNGFSMFMQALGDVMDTAAPQNFENEVRALALAVSGVRALDKVRMRKSGLSHLVDIQVRVDGDLTVREGHGIAHAVKDALIASASHRISDVTVHIEPAAGPGL